MGESDSVGILYLYAGQGMPVGIVFINMSTIDRNNGHYAVRARKA